MRLQAVWRGVLTRRRLAALHVKVAKAQAVVRGKLQRARFLRVRACPCAARASRG